MFYESKRTELENFHVALFKMYWLVVRRVADHLFGSECPSRLNCATGNGSGHLVIWNDALLPDVDASGLDQSCEQKNQKF